MKQTEKETNLTQPLMGDQKSIFVKKNWVMKRTGTNGCASGFQDSGLDSRGVILKKMFLGEPRCGS